MNKLKLSLIAIVIIAAASGYYLWTKGVSPTSTKTPKEKVQTIGDGPTKITYAVHWLEKYQIDGIYQDGKLVSKGLRHYLEEYASQNPDVSFELRQIPYGEYADKLVVLHQADLAPDIYQIYSQWGVTYVALGMLDKPPQDILEDINSNYLSTKGASINGTIWGIPTEINDYSLLYNKEIFAQEGIQTPPRTWKEFVDLAQRLTKKDENGAITRYGVAFLKDNDWQVVDPFLSLVFSNGGSFLTSDNKKSLINSHQAVAALQAQTKLFQNGSTSLDANFFDFGAGKVAMVISPPWVKGGFKDEKTGFGNRFSEVVGVAPFPYLSKPASLQYAWFMGVMNSSKNKDAAWDFLRWFSIQVQPETNTTRYGDLLADTIGAIPSRKVDVENHKSLKDSFTSTFVDELPRGVAEPNVLQSNKIKSILMGEIQAAWAQEKSPKKALDDASAQIDELLQTVY